MRVRNMNGARGRGFSLIEVMVSTSVVVIGLLALASASTTTSLLRKRGIQEDIVFEGLMSRLEWVRGELYTASAFQAAVEASLAGGGAHVASYLLDNDNDGIQDLSFAAGDQATPVIQVTVSPPDAPADSSDIVQVLVSATWYGVGGARSTSISSFVANRSGYGGP
ncbi:MAG: type II secretion system protein [Planctomycetes bacterium]|nr:type II secretion system protein [Planctomycetota bacterium]